MRKENFKTTKETLITTREKAILEKDDNFSNPVAVWLSKENDLFTTTAQASYYICKYANMLIFEAFDEAMKRSAMYRDFERHAHEETCNLFKKEVQ